MQHPTLDDSIHNKYYKFIIFGGEFLDILLAFYVYKCTFLELNCCSYDLIAGDWIIFDCVMNIVGRETTSVGICSKQ